MDKQTLDKLMDNLNHNIINILEIKRHNLEININKAKMLNPNNLIQNNKNTLKELVSKLNNIMDKNLTNLQYNLDYLINTLKLVNPLNILSNGYSLVKKDNKVIKSYKDLNIGDIINIKFHEGEILSEVKEKKNE